MTVHREPVEIRLRRKRRRKRDRVIEKPAGSSRCLRAVDAAFADLPTTTSGREKPVRQSLDLGTIPPLRGTFQQLTSQLRVLEAQQRQLAQLLHELQTMPSA